MRWGLTDTEGVDQEVGRKRRLDVLVYTSPRTLRGPPLGVHQGLVLSERSVGSGRSSYGKRTRKEIITYHGNG